MITRRPTITGQFARACVRARARLRRRARDPWEPGMLDWLEATIDDIARVWRGIRGGAR